MARGNNPDEMVLLLLLAVGGAMAYVLMSKKKGADGGAPPTGQLTYDQACSKARDWMRSQDASWGNATCQQIVDHLRTDTSIFGRNIRGPLGL